MIDMQPNSQEGTAVPQVYEIPDDATANERTLTEALLDEINLKGRLPGGAFLPPNAALDVARAIIGKVTIAVPAVSAPVTARGLTESAAEILAEARKINHLEGAGLASALVAGAEQYRLLAIAVANNAALRPEEKDDHR